MSCVSLWLIKDRQLTFNKGVLIKEQVCAVSSHRAHPALCSVTARSKANSYPVTPHFMCSRGQRIFRSNLTECGWADFEIGGRYFAHHKINSVLISVNRELRREKSHSVWLCYRMIHWLALLQLTLIIMYSEILSIAAISFISNLRFVNDWN